MPSPAGVEGRAASEEGRPSASCVNKHIRPPSPPPHSRPLAFVALWWDDFLINKKRMHFYFNLLFCVSLHLLGLCTYSDVIDSEQLLCVLL